MNLNIGLNTSESLSLDVGDVTDFLKQSELNGKMNNDITLWCDISNVAVYASGDNFEINISGDYFNNLDDRMEKSFKFCLLVPKKFDMNILKKRIWNKIVAECKLKKEGFKTYDDLDYTKWI